MKKLKSDLDGQLLSAADDPTLVTGGHLECSGPIEKKRRLALNRLDRRLQRKQTRMQRFELYMEIIERDDLGTNYVLAYPPDLTAADDYADAAIAYFREKQSRAERKAASLEPAAAKGRKMEKNQADRRARYLSKRKATWAEWQKWIDEKRRTEGWSLDFAQRKAAKELGPSLKTIRRRTQ